MLTPIPTLNEIGIDPISKDLKTFAEMLSIHAMRICDGLETVDDVAIDLLRLYRREASQRAVEIVGNLIWAAATGEGSDDIPRIVDMANRAVLIEVTSGKTIPRRVPPRPTVAVPVAFFDTASDAW
jgi:hypothetical protein